MIPKVIIRKPDLDTCFTAFILLGNTPCDLQAVTGVANSRDLADPETICIECGGSGQVELCNFDHHDPLKYHPPACRQAAMIRGINDEYMEQLVQYVCDVDEASIPKGKQNNLMFSSLFSGMLHITSGVNLRFSRAQTMLKQLTAEQIDPYKIQRIPREWQQYNRARQQHSRHLKNELNKTVFLKTSGGRKTAYLDSRITGGSRTLYNLGCELVVLRNISSVTSLVKYTIASPSLPVARLLPTLDLCEQGWGGRERIIGSPFQGSILSPADVLHVIHKHF
jgi:hypothetical protein